MKAGFRVAEPLGHDLDRHPVAEQQGRVGVADVVEPDGGHSEAALGAGKGLGCEVRVERSAWGGPLAWVWWPHVVGRVVWDQVLSDGGFERDSERLMEVEDGLAASGRPL